MLPRLAAFVDTVRIVATASTPLSRTGFYDRMQRVQRGAFTAEFLTPEELEQRDRGRTSEILSGSRFVRLLQSGGARSRVILTGRGGCPMNIVIDGQAIQRTLEETATTGAPSSIMSSGSARRYSEDVLSIDELLDGRAIMAIEIYPSGTNAPAEITPPSGRGACGIVVIWTGARR
ncbi:MAG: hypothetical protein K2X99_10650 [Gemmatimonadaceae bacterium]|nr:hypothetical protein [Gemmatimonadaceae bacterium]